MNGDRLTELLRRDMDSIPVPDIWDRVQQRIEELPSAETEKHHTRRKRTSPLIFVLIGGGTVCVSLFLIIAASKLPELTLHSGMISGGSQPSAAIGAPDLPMLSAERNSLALSGRSAEELETLLGRLDEGDRVYEDSAYLYRFDSSGTLKYMINSESGIVIDIEKTACLLLQKHFPDISIENYSITIDDSGERPSLVARADAEGEGLTITEIKVTFYTDEWPTLLGVAEE